MERLFIEYVDEIQYDSVEKLQQKFGRRLQEEFLERFQQQYVKTLLRKKKTPGSISKKIEGGICIKFPWREYSMHPCRIYEKSVKRFQDRFRDVKFWGICRDISEHIHEVIPGRVPRRNPKLKGELLKRFQEGTFLENSVNILREESVIDAKGNL